MESNKATRESLLLPPYWKLVQPKGGKLTKWVKAKDMQGKYDKLNILIGHMGPWMLLL